MIMPPLQTPSTTSRARRRPAHWNLHKVFVVTFLTFSVGLNLVQMGRPGGGSRNAALLDLHSSSSWGVPNTNEFAIADPMQPSSSLSTSSNNTSAFHSNPGIPRWMADYFEWHQQQRIILDTARNATGSYWNATGVPRLAVLVCLERHLKCGGASDRLHVMPWAVLVAARSRRLLLIKWERPCALEEFWMPNQLDWRVPDALWADIRRRKIPRDIFTAGKRGLVLANKTSPVMFLQQQSHDHGRDLYDDSREHPETEPAFYGVFRHVWEAFFKPSPPVQALIDEQMRVLGLKPRQYIATHVRQKYIKDKTKDWAAVEKAIRCSYSRRPDLPIYFASDSHNATRHALWYGRNEALKGNSNVNHNNSSSVDSSNNDHSNITVVGRLDSVEPLHLDRGRVYFENSHAWKAHEPSEYYDVFVDLVLLAQAQCVVYGVGGYGMFASAMTTEDCSFRHTTSKRECTWTDWNITLNGTGISAESRRN